MDKRSLLVPLALVLPAIGFAQIVLDNTITPSNAVQNILLGNGVTVSNITFNGQPGNLLNEQIGGFDGTNCNIGISNGVILATGDIAEALGPNDNCCSSTGGGNFGQTDADLEILAGQNINDAAILEFDFIPTGDSLKFDFVFASEEYPDFVCSINDVFGFFLSGPGIMGPFSNNAINIALIPGTNVPVGVNTVNGGVAAGDPANCAAIDPNWDTHTALFVDNGDGSQAPYNGSPFYVQYDGFTVVLTARAHVTCGLTYHIKLAIGDASDTAWDSAVFLQAGSFASTGQVIPELTAGVSVNDSTMFEGCGLIPFVFHRVGDTTNTDTVHLNISGTATAGVDYSPPLPNELIYQPGDTAITFLMNVPLDADGIETLDINITQNIICSGQQVQTDYHFYIDQYPPLNVVTNDIIGSCGQQYVLAPIVNGGTPDKHFLWNTGATTPTITVQPAVTTTYYFTVSDTCGVQPWNDSITVTMPVYPPIQVDAGPEALIPCLGAQNISPSVTAGGNGSYTYQWRLNGAVVGNTATINVPAANPSVFYFLTVTDGCGNTGTDSVEVGQVPLQPITFSAMDRTAICVGDTVVLQVTDEAGGNGVYSYAWTNVQQQTLSTADTLQVGVPQDAAYTVTVIDQCGYEADTVVHALIPHPAPFVLTFNPDTVICAGDTLRLWARVTGGSGYYRIEWPGFDLTDPIMDVSPPVNQTYVVNVYDQCGEVVGDQVDVGVEAPVAQIIATSQGQDDWFFKAATRPTFCRTYRWDLGDNTLSRKSELTHSYLDLEEHWVRLKVVSFTGCVAYDSLLVRPPAHLYFPNAFTPDGDGLNETFGPVGHYIEDFEMTIFDRWGEVVYQTDDFTKPWDGRVNGADATTGVYVYKYKASGHLFPAVEDYGHVTLLRGSTGK